MSTLRLFLVLEDKHKVRKIHLQRRPAIQEVAEKMLELAEIDADVEVVSFKLEKGGLLDMHIFGRVFDAKGDLEGEMKE